MRVRDATILEMLDAAQLDDADLAANLRDIRRINALLGWTAFTTRAIARAVRTSGKAEFSLLDVACGSADMPLAIAHWASTAGIAAQIVASDLSPQIVRIATKQTAHIPAITVEQQDALHLTYAPSSFDIALCTLALHHFDPDSAVEVLRNLARVGRQVLVFDLARSSLAYAGAIALTRVAGMNVMTRHDAPASVRRAYSAPELRELARRAGLRDAVVREQFPFRLALRASGSV